MRGAPHWAPLLRARRRPGAHVRHRPPERAATLRARPCSAAKLKAVKADKADVDALAHEFDLPKAVAERQLRLAGGDVHAAFRSLMGLQQEPAVR